MSEADAIYDTREAAYKRALAASRDRAIDRARILADVVQDVKADLDEATERNGNLNVQLAAMTQERDALRRENEQLRRDICRAMDLLWSAVEWMSADGCDCGVGEPGTCTLCRVHEFVETKAGKEGE